MIDVRRANDRFHTAIDWLDSWHSFSFSSHYDPANVGHGLLLVSNDDRVAPGQGFGAHAHQDMEIVTWVLEGALAHQDSAGHSGIITPGIAQRMSAGTGIRHSEMNANADEPVHFVQMWVRPDTAGIEPGYEQVDISDRLTPGELVAVSSCSGSSVRRTASPSARSTAMRAEPRATNTWTWSAAGMVTVSPSSRRAAHSTAPAWWRWTAPSWPWPEATATSPPASSRSLMSTCS